MKPNISLITCTHNPRTDYLQRTLQALKVQTLRADSWELLLVDNASAKLLSAEIDLSWHPTARHLREEQLGLTHARLRGIGEAEADILVFVDDDNVLAPDYLENVLTVFNENPCLGVIGGIIEGEFEVEPPRWSKPYLPYLAIVDLGKRSFYACSLEVSYSPPGAGMAIKKTVAQYYAEQLKRDSIRQGLDCVGDGLLRAGDTDMALCALDMGLARGYYPQLKLTHLITKNRLEPDYIQRLMEGAEYSATLLALVRSYISIWEAPPFWRRKLTDLKWLISHRNAHPLQRKIERARERGRARAHAYYQSLRSTPTRTTPEERGGMLQAPSHGR